MDNSADGSLATLHIALRFSEFSYRLPELARGMDQRVLVTYMDYIGVVVMVAARVWYGTWKSLIVV